MKMRHLVLSVALAMLSPASLAQNSNTNTNTNTAYQQEGNFGGGFFRGTFQMSNQNMTINQTFDPTTGEMCQYFAVPQMNLFQLLNGPNLFFGSTAFDEDCVP